MTHGKGQACGGDQEAFGKMKNDNVKITMQLDMTETIEVGSTGQYA